MQRFAVETTCTRSPVVSHLADQLFLQFANYGLLRRFALPTTNALPMALAAGMFDVCGVALFVLGTRQGRLDVVAVLSSLYPAMTVVLAGIYLKEHINGPQRLGMLAALGAVALIA